MKDILVVGKLKEVHIILLIGGIVLYGFGNVVYVWTDMKAIVKHGKTAKQKMVEDVMSVVIIWIITTHLVFHSMQLQM